MAKKPARKPNTTPRASSKPAKPRRAAPTDRTGRGPTDPLTPEQRAQVWALRAEGQSLRQIGREVGCDAKTAQRIMLEDPERYAALATELREERATLWRGLENRSLRTLDVAAAEAEAILNRVRKGAKVSKADLERVQVLRGLMTPLRMVADSATSKTQLLTGQPTEITQGVGGVLDMDRMSPEELADMATQLGMVEHLPARLRELAEKRAAAAETRVH